MLISVMTYNNNINWVLVLNKTLYEYNILRHSATNRSPAEAFLGISGINTIANIFK
jgi:hypothetical protein